MNNLKPTLTILLSSLVISTYGATPSSYWDELERTRVESNHDIEWEQVSPGNAGFVNLVRFHPTIAGKVMTCPDMWSAFQSDNNGDSWYSLTDFDGDASFFHIRDLYYSVSNPNIGVAICSSELWVTPNLGKNWEVVKNCPWYRPTAEGRDSSRGRKIASLAIDPNDDKIWFVGGGANVRGQEWLSSYKEFTQKHPHGQRSEYEGMLWRTKDGGKNWDLVNSGLDPKAQVGRIIVNPMNSQQVFAASNYGIYRSDDGGSTWRMISEGKLDNNIIMDMDEYYNANTKRFILYAIDQTQYEADGKSTRCTGGIFKSDDLGETWTKINGNLSLDLNRLSGGVSETYYSYISKWFSDEDIHTMVQNPIPELVEAVKERFPELPKEALQTFWMISTDPTKEGRVYIGMADPQIYNSIMPGRLWVSEDDGESWTNTARLFNDAWERDKEYWEERGNPWRENMVVGHQSDHHRSGDDYALRSMRGLDVGLDGTVMIISDHSTMRSNDHGESWHQVDEYSTPSGALIGRGNSNLCFHVIGQDKRTATTLLASCEHYLWVPEAERYDGKIAIRQIQNGTPPTINALAFDPYDPNSLYLTSGRQEQKQYISKSTDLGENWEIHGVATPATNVWKDDFFTNSLLIDPVNPQYMYHGITTIENKDRLTEGGFYKSTDGGKNFYQSSKGLPEIARVKSIVFDPRDKSYQSLYASVEIYKSGWRGPITSEGGLYHSSDRGDSWQKVNTPAEVEGVQFIRFDNTDRMYITTGHISSGGGAGTWYTDDFCETWSQIFMGKGCECFDISPFDNNILALSMCSGSKNPGFYISRDRGLTWSKNNRAIVIPQAILDIKFDIFKPNKMWITTNGTGCYRGTIVDGDNIQVVESTDFAHIKDDKPVALSAKIVNKDFAGSKIVWKSENDKIATVDEAGVVTPIGRGQVKIWATTDDERFTDYTVVTLY